MRAVDRRKEQRVRLGGKNSFKSRINRHGFVSQPTTINPQPPARLGRDDAVKGSVKGHVQLVKFYPQGLKENSLEFTVKGISGP